MDQCAGAGAGAIDGPEPNRSRKLPIIGDAGAFTPLAVGSLIPRTLDTVAVARPAGRGLARTVSLVAAQRLGLVARKSLALLERLTSAPVWRIPLLARAVALAAPAGLSRGACEGLAASINLTVELGIPIISARGVVGILGIECAGQLKLTQYTRDTRFGLIGTGCSEFVGSSAICQRMCPGQLNFQRSNHYYH